MIVLDVQSQRPSFFHFPVFMYSRPSPDVTRSFVFAVGHDFHMSCTTAISVELNCFGFWSKGYSGLSLSVTEDYS